MKPKRKGWKAVPGLRRVLDAQPGKLEFILRAKGLVGEPPSEPAVQVTCGGGGQVTASSKVHSSRLKGVAVGQS